MLTNIVQETNAGVLGRRRHARFPFETGVEVVLVPSGEWFTGAVNNISLGGCYIKAQMPSPVGSELRLRFAVADGVFETPAIVRSRIENEGMGVEFTSTSSSEQIKLERLLAHLASHGPDYGRSQTADTEVRSLALILDAVMELLREKGVISSAELSSKMQSLQKSRTDETLSQEDAATKHNRFRQFENHQVSVRYRVGDSVSELFGRVIDDTGVSLVVEEIFPVDPAPVIRQIIPYDQIVEVSEAPR
jgi:hypothetical protein